MRKGTKMFRGNRVSDKSFMTVDRVLTIATTIIGALTMVIWGIVWMNLTNIMGRTATLEGDKRVIEQRLKSIDDGQDQIQLDLKEVKAAVDRIRK